MAGSVKARGGFYAVLSVAERLALTERLLIGPDDDYRRLGESQARAAFARHSLTVGSTGNLGLSIGLLGRSLGFAVTVHMASPFLSRPKTAQRLSEPELGKRPL